jgi:hypothetical protein
MHTALSPVRVGASLVTALLLSCQPAGAQDRPDASPERDAVLTVVDRFMRAIAASDVAGLRALQLEGTSTTVASPAPGGGTRISRRAESGTLPPGLRERYWDPTVLMRGSIAVVWTPYEFWRDGKTTHCGIDVFDLVKQEGEWRIAHVMYTVEPEACPALRPGDPKTIRPAS